MNENDHVSDADARAAVVHIVDQAQISMLTTMTDQGTHVSRPMAVQEVEFDGDLWFFCYDDSPKTQQVGANPQVNVAISDPEHSSWASLSGAAEVVHDRARAEELWSAPLEVWFPDGLDTDGLALLRVTVETAEYWDSPSSTVRKLIGGVRAAVTGNPDAFPGENATTRLDPSS